MSAREELNHFAKAIEKLTEGMVEQALDKCEMDSFRAATFLGLTAPALRKWIQDRPEFEERMKEKGLGRPPAKHSRGGLSASAIESGRVLRKETRTLAPNAEAQKAYASRMLMSFNDVLGRATEKKPFVQISKHDYNLIGKALNDTAVEFAHRLGSKASELKDMRLAVMDSDMSVEEKLANLQLLEQMRKDIDKDVEVVRKVLDTRGKLYDVAGTPTSDDLVEGFIAEIPGAKQLLELAEQKTGIELRNDHAGTEQEEEQIVDAPAHAGRPERPQVSGLPDDCGPAWTEDTGRSEGGGELHPDDAGNKEG